MSAIWYCLLDGTAVGPMSASELIRLAEAGRIKPSTMIRKGERGNWQPAIEKDWLPDTTVSQHTTCPIEPQTPRLPPAILTERHGQPSQAPTPLTARNTPFPVLVVAGVLLLIGAAISYRHAENSARNTNAAIGRLESADALLSRAFGGSPSGGYRSSSYANPEQGLTWFLAASGAVSLIAGVAISGRR